MVPEGNVPRKQHMPRDSHIIWIGDFLSPLDTVRDIVADFSRQGVHGFLLQVLDPAEKELPYDGRILFGGMELGEQDLLVRNAGSLRKKYRQAIIAHNKEIEKLSKSFNWGYLSHVTNGKPESVLNNLCSHFSGTQRD